MGCGGHPPCPPCSGGASPTGDQAPWGHHPKWVAAPWERVSTHPLTGDTLWGGEGGPTAMGLPHAPGGGCRCCCLAVGGLPAPQGTRSPRGFWLHGGPGAGSGPADRGARPFLPPGRRPPRGARVWQGQVRVPQLQGERGRAGDTAGGTDGDPEAGWGVSWCASRGAGGLALLPGEAGGAGRDTGGVPGAPPEPAAALQEGKLLDRVYNTYLLMHTHQTVDFVQKKVRDPHGVHPQPRPGLPGGAPLPPGRVPRGLGSVPPPAPHRVPRAPSTGAAPCAR